LPFHPSAQKCSSEQLGILEAAIARGPLRIASIWIESPFLEATQTLMAHPGVSLDIGNRWVGNG